MLVSLSESDGGLACVKIIGKLTADDYQSLMDMFFGILVSHGELYLYVNLQEFDGWEWQASWDKDAFSVKYWDKIMQIAMVGTDRWAHLGAQAAETIKTANVRYFGVAENAQALAWVQNHSVPNENFPSINLEINR